MAKDKAEKPYKFGDEDTSALDPAAPLLVKPKEEQVVMGRVISRVDHPVDLVFTDGNISRLSPRGIAEQIALSSLVSVPNGTSFKAYN